MSWVYVIDGGAGFWKVGAAGEMSGVLRGRVSRAPSGVVVDEAAARLVCTVECVGAWNFELESTLHEELPAADRIGGSDWFRATPAALHALRCAMFVHNAMRRPRVTWLHPVALGFPEGVGTEPPGGISSAFAGLHPWVPERHEGDFLGDWVERQRNTPAWPLLFGAILAGGRGRGPPQG